MTIALFFLVAAHTFDYVTFLAMTARHGLAAELNPIVVHLAEEYGIPGLTIAKVASVVFLASVALLISSQRKRVAGVVVFIGIAAGAVGGLSNIASI